MPVKNVKRKTNDGFEGVITGLNDKEKEKIVLYYVGEIEADELIKLLKSKLPRYMIPNKVNKLDRMPLTANGKIDRVFLSNKYKEKTKEK